ncbi:MAG: MBL fold metallo-hydrolase [Bacteroidaceae bacterium]|nr:MBL fold metallo-hydrolase [Bacteroidaceae bacterium]
MITLLTGLFSCSGNGWKEATPDQFEDAMRSAGTCVIDVRTAAEYAEGHLYHAVNIDWQKDGFIEEISKYFHGENLLAIYCKSGKRSAAAAAALSEAGFKVLNLTDGYTGWTAAGKMTNKYPVECISVSEGGDPLFVTLIKHGSLELSYLGYSIQVDPVSGYGKNTDYATEFPKADAILITHEHGDHLDKNAIMALSSEKTRVLMNAKSHEQTGIGEVISNGQHITLAPLGIIVEAVPAYNTTPGREQFHPKGNGNGYLIRFLGSLSAYVAGDTEDVPEMADLYNEKSRVSVAFLPVNQPYTMTVDQCVNAARMVKPRILIPYHFGQTDISELPEQLPEMKVLLRDMQ